MAFIKIIQHDQAEGQLKEIYDDLVQKRGKLAEVHKIQSLNPQTIVGHMNLYMDIMFARSPLKRYQREMIAVVVSVANNCHYCLTHHAAAVLHFWKDEAKVKLLASGNWDKLDFSETDRSLCLFAKQLTISPKHPERESIITHLKDLKLSDRAILDATLVVSYFNFVNRMVLGLGVDLEQDGEIGRAHV